MRVSSALTAAAPQDANRGRRAWPVTGTNEPRLALESIGYLAPHTRFEGRVHSVFAHACNLEWRDGLLTVCTAAGARGPTVLRLTAGATQDLRALFDVGEPCDGSANALRTARVAIEGARAIVWRPVEPGPPECARRIASNLQRADAAVAARTDSALRLGTADAAPWVAALGEACSRIDVTAAEHALDRLIGWGEGLTPAGDDAVSGLLAAIDAPTFETAPRRRFRGALRAACIARLARTTPIAAHLLRLAAHGHHAEPVLQLRDALLTAPDERPVDTALDRLLAIGATSGAASVFGLLAGLRARLPAPDHHEAERA